MAVCPKINNKISRKENIPKIVTKTSVLFKNLKSTYDNKKKTEKEETKIEEKFVESVEKNAPLGVPQIAEGGGKKPIEAIRLNAQNIKSENDEFIEEPKKSNYGIYLLGGFCVLLGILFGVKKLRKDKNEFR